MDQTRRMLVQQAAAILLVVGVVAIAAALRVASLSAQAAAVGVLTVAMCAGSIALARSRYSVLLAGVSLIGSWLTALFVIAFMRGGLSAPLMIAVPTVPVIAATVLSRRAAWFVLLAILIGLALLLVTQFSGRPLSAIDALNEQYDLMRAFWVAVSALMATKLATYITLRNEQLRHRLEHLASTDGLTGVNNRRAISTLLAAEIARSVRNGDALSVLMIDVDHFKVLNDSRGHLAGDEALCRIARTVAPLLRVGGDAVGRWGGEEFLVVLPRTEPGEAAHVADRIRRGIAELAIPRHAHDTESLTVTVGVAGGFGITNAEQLVLEADQALYRGKAAGRDRVEVMEDHVALSA